MGFCFYLMGIAYAQYPFEVLACALSFYTSFLIKKKKNQDGWVGLKPFHEVI